MFEIKIYTDAIVGNGKWYVDIAGKNRAIVDTVQEALDFLKNLYEKD